MNHRIDMAFTDIGRRAHFIVFTLVLAMSTPLMAMAHTEDAPTTSDNAKLLSCAHGSIGERPDPAPPGFESEFAEAVVVINRSRQITNATVSGFELFDNAGNVSRLKRVVEVDAFDARHIANGSHPWDGTLPAGMIRLRVRVALISAPKALSGFCTLRIGPYVIKGPWAGYWPT